MKVSSMGRRNTGGEKFHVKKTGDLTTISSDFKNVLGTINQKEVDKNLERLLAEVDEMAKKLAKSCTINDLKNYKKAVQNFLKETIGKAYIAQDQRSWNSFGKQKLYILVKKVDKKLEELSKKVLEKQVNTLDILKRIDEIRGLLVDISI